MPKETSSEKARRTALSGIMEEHRTVDAFNKWPEDVESRKWMDRILHDRGLNPEEVLSVNAIGLGGKSTKTDVRVDIAMKNPNASIESINIQVKRLSGKSSGHQIDRRSPESFGKILGMSDKAIEGLQEFTGVFSRRKYMEEIDSSKKGEIVKFFERKENVEKFFDFIFNGSDESLAPHYTLLVQECGGSRKTLFLSEEEVLKKGSAGWNAVISCQKTEWPKAGNENRWNHPSKKGWKTKSRKHPMQVQHRKIF